MPVGPELDMPFEKNWLTIGTWKVDEHRTVHSWLPAHAALDLDKLFEGFLDMWGDTAWSEGLRTTLAWYIAANASNTPNEARIVLCQVALEVLASLRGLENGQAHDRIRRLLDSFHIPTSVPSRLAALSQFASKFGTDAPGCLTRLRNKLEHPTSVNLKYLEKIDGILRHEAAQYGLELFELTVLGIMDYRGKYTRRAYAGWAGNDEVDPPWL